MIFLISCLFKAECKLSQYCTRISILLFSIFEINLKTVYIHDFRLSLTSITYYFIRTDPNYFRNFFSEWIPWSILRSFWIKGSNGPLYLVHTETVVITRTIWFRIGSMGPICHNPNSGPSSTTTSLINNL